jgi:hypothetical protein
MGIVIREKGWVWNVIGKECVKKRMSKIEDG